MRLKPRQDHVPELWGIWAPQKNPKNPNTAKVVGTDAAPTAGDYSHWGTSFLAASYNLFRVVSTDLAWTLLMHHWENGTCIHLYTLACMHLPSGHCSIIQPVIQPTKVKIGDGSVQTLCVRASDRCKDAAERFISENSLKARVGTRFWKFFMWSWPDLHSQPCWALPLQPCHALPSFALQHWSLIAYSSPYRQPSPCKCVMCTFTSCCERHQSFQGACGWFQCCV